MNVGTYKITSGLATSPYFRKLNLYSSGSVSNGMNVVLYETDQSDEQKWYFDGERLYPETDSTHSYCLDRYTASAYLNNADIWKASAADADCQKLSIIPVSADDDYYRIRLDTKVNNEYYYLTAYSNANGTGSGKSTTSAGNVYWAPATGGWNQKWDFSLVGGSSGDNTGGDEEIGGDTGETSYYPEGYYRFFTNDVKYLNANSNSTINLKATKTGSREQFWSFFNGKLKSENYTSVGLAGTSSVTLSTNPATIQVIDKGNNECYIKNVGSGKYLYVSSNTLIWSNNKTLLKIESIIKMNNVPYMGTEYFSANSGFPATTWQSTWSNNIRNLAKTIYGTTNNIADSYSFYNLYGAVYTSSEYIGGFHTGIDMSYGGRGQEIHAPVDGTIVSTGTAFGRVTIKSGNKYYILLHLDSERLPAKGTVYKGDPIGFQSDTGVESNDPDRPDKNVHVHIEVSSTEKASDIPDESFNFPGNTECPYY